VVSMVAMPSLVLADHAADGLLALGLSGDINRRVVRAPGQSGLNARGGDLPPGPDLWHRLAATHDSRHLSKFRLVA
jgi:hypothetical protein